MVKKGSPTGSRNELKFTKFDTWAPPYSNLLPRCPTVVPSGPKMMPTGPKKMPPWSQNDNNCTRNDGPGDKIIFKAYQSNNHQSLQKRGRRQWAKPLRSAAPCLRHGARRVKSSSGSAKSKLAGPAPAAGPPPSSPVSTAFSFFLGSGFLMIFGCWE